MNKKIIIGVVIGVVVVAAALVGFLWLPSHQSETGVPNTPVTGGTAPVVPVITNITLNRSAYQVALSRAEQWESDAALMKMNSLDNTGNAWDFTFISPKTKGKGFEVQVSGQNVTSAQAVTISGGGTPLPENVISPDDAIADAHAVPGYANAAIVSVEILYNAAAHQWYWGVKTSNGVTLTIKATP